ncbi:MAG: carbohydrate ABC transporter permease [Nocardioidaceae bacterium]|nr:carbohydrate ABC transporter permease [Nocardioidaceae bacterium]
MRGSDWRTLGALVAAALFALPLLLLVTGSFRPDGVPAPATPELWPDPASTGSYSAAIELGGLGRATLNSLVVAVVAVPLSTLVAAWAGFALTRLPPRSRGVVLGLCLVALMVPVTALVVPRFALYRQLGLIDTLVPLMAPALIATSPFYVLVYYLAFRAVPRDLYDACLLADVSPMRTWWRVAMPLVRPVTVAVAALTFVLSWSNFLEALVFVYDRELFTLPLALRSLSTLDSTDYPVLLAGSVLAALPAVVLFGVAQRRFLHQYRGPGWLGR